ncbi:MAG TPA: methyltransferase domain-containing protein [Ktedonobacteraceae bacterium]|jgi:tRNA (cmo5U34)-methyltransferase|nr:methyltransferase domain-containing protein [Ktedonobacteraceae bacterium]
MTKDSIGHMPTDAKWDFDQSVTDVFEDMLVRSIPQYEVMRQSVFDIASPFVKPHTAIVDLGCARGDALAPFVEKFWHQTTCVGIEVSQPMLQCASDRFSNGWIEPHASIRSLDLRKDYPPEKASVTLSILTLQFVPIEYRQRIIREVFKHTVPGGVFILVEKLLGSSAEIDTLLVKNYYALKATNGYSQEAIERKRLSLEGVLVPVTARWNEELLHMAGFQQIDCFWRYLNFAGWIAIREN